MSQSNMFILMVVIPLILSQSTRGKDCVCELQSSEAAFPENKLKNVEITALKCTRNITSEKMTEIDRLVLGLQHRISQLLENVSMLEKEDNGNLYAAVSLHIIELELAEIQDLMDKLNRTTNNYQLLSGQTATELQDMEETMAELERFDHAQVMEKQRENQRVKRDLEWCKDVLNSTTPAPTLPPDYCGLGSMVNVSGPKTYSLTVYGTSYTFGAWGRDAQPAPGDENKYWLVVLSSGNVHGNFIRQYSSMSTIILGIGPKDTYISSSNPTTNTIQGPNMVMYGNALYYNCYNTYSVCQFNMTTRAVSTVALPNDAGFNNKFPFAHLAATYAYTDMDFATDELGVYVIYATTSNFGNVMISKVETSNPPVISQTWSTSLHKRTATNTFMVCGVLYATRYLDQETEEIFYSFDTQTNEERYDLSIHIKKMQTNIKYMNYNPSDNLLYVYSDAYIVTYEIMFQEVP
ncbi:olfactomedin-4-like [Pimephales promelas]|uniref:olfactomedin-4-like n=1 Tax=Pimephales promelas TaxID=90988 RepID=UPI001955EA02|nr:olfactomedin-4-like [Pimephales promelas]KAG1938261.1 olfactomedin-4 [Pimephales promelas]